MQDSKAIDNSRDIKRQIRNFVLNELAHRKGVHEFSDDDLLVCKGVIDSLGIIRLVGFLEDRFHISIPDGEITEDHFATLNTLEQFVKGRIPDHVSV